MNPAGIS